MRQVATVPDEVSAKLLADYLLTLDISTKLIPSGEGCGVWVHREEKVDQAKAESAAFLLDPSDEKYQGVSKIAEAARKEAANKEREHAKNSIRLEGKLNVPSWGRCPVTYAMITASILVTVLTSLGIVPGDLFYFTTNPVSIEASQPETIEVGPGQIRVLSRPILVQHAPGLKAIRSGQVWRLLTPIFIHAPLFSGGFGPLHLIYNMIWLYQLGGLIELRKGSWKLLAMILFTGIFSNFSQYYWEVMRYGPEEVAAFGGMSGVVYALFGYVWMKSDYDPDSDMRLPSNTIVYMMLWLVFCMSGTIGPIANAAHVGGLILGILIGVMPHVWDDLRWW